MNAKCCADFLVKSTQGHGKLERSRGVVDRSIFCSWAGGGLDGGLAGAHVNGMTYSSTPYFS